MSTALKWKLIAGFVLVFIAGGATGVFMSATVARHCLFAPANHGLVAQSISEPDPRRMKSTSSAPSWVSSAPVPRS